MKEFIRKHKTILIVTFALSILISFIGCSFIYYWIWNDVNKRFEEQHKRQEKLQQSIEKTSSTLDNIDSEMKSIEAKVRSMSYKGSVDRHNIDELYFSVDTDLKENTPTLTVRDVDNLIYEWDKKTGHKSGLVGKGKAFIEAANKTGYNPVYLFAHAALESGFGTSYFATSRGNMYGIGAFDSNTDNAYYMADNMYDGIINGGVWINNNYYKEGKTTLREMSTLYASNVEWKDDISKIVNKSYEILANQV